MNFLRSMARWPRWLALGAALPLSALAGGGGENLLLIVNPADEPSLRIANAYAEIRQIPDNNVMFISPGTGIPILLWSSSFQTLYLDPILDGLTARGIAGQIDYIGTLGQPHGLAVSSQSTTHVIGFNNTLNHLTQIRNGMGVSIALGRASELYKDPLTGFSYDTANSAAIYHSQMVGNSANIQWYLSGMIGYAGVRGLTVSQNIENLRRTAAGDGTKPQGTIYFENSGDGDRVGPRIGTWPAASVLLGQAGIPSVQEFSTYPKNRADVRGAVIGSGNPISHTAMINGSRYLPGSWADNLTSFAGAYEESNQPKVAGLLLAGAGGAAGTITEPTNDKVRFTSASLYLYSHDGNTLGESFYRSVKQPDLIMFQGDLLSQAYADIPVVQRTGGPADHAQVSGNIAFEIGATLNSPRLATGISKLRLFLDGIDTGQVINAATGTFNLDTTTLSDGLHEVRFVAYNNAPAASQGRLIQTIVVNNQGQSLAVTGASSYDAAWDGVLSIPVTAIAGSGPAITSVQLRSLGRVVGTLNAATGNVSLDVKNLAFGSNKIVPFGIYASGTKTLRGPAITVTRRPRLLPGAPPVPIERRNPGADFSYYSNAAGNNSTLASINFNATPSLSLHSNSLAISPDSANKGAGNMPAAFFSGDYVATNLAIQVKTNFTVTTPGEYFFYPDSRNYTSFGLYIDNILIASKDAWNGTTWQSAVAPAPVYLQPGQHTLVMRLGQSRGGRVSYETTVSLNYRGPEGTTTNAGGPFFYTLDKSKTP
jgi:hypothetical protein